MAVQPYLFGRGAPKFTTTTELTSGVVVSGTTYTIIDFIAGDDFTNIGGTNVDGNIFTATGTTPTTWTNSSILVETVTLDYAKLIPSWAEPDEIINESVITGVRDIIALGDYSSFKVIVYLWKYSGLIAKFEEIYAFNHDDVWFYPHRDGDVLDAGLGKPMQDSSGDEVEFHITHIRPFYYQYERVPQNTPKIALEITFISKDYIDLTKNLT